ncbi:energy transducer TonB [Sphingobium phenoxybenzoativorans]|uniref:Energy transducer TonB n=1 Tax=Sphingobium phenoxybenzoativorans TaxID=1592790 RepID=A0A975Q1I1_9SPHN|nr:energy transducer TonB [Sphingobium phenoxybenzoativorans]QUT05980.1 energy transducer TonB [Sphingobium phenoxybenzoativorans]
MFDTVTQIDEVAEADARAVSFAPRRPAAPPSAGHSSGERYGARRINMPAAIAVALIHVALFGALFQMRTIYIQKKAASLAVVNLTPPAPPPPAEAEPVPPTRPEVVAPRPIVQTPVPVVYQVPVIDKITPLPVVQAPPAPPAPVAIPSTIDAGDLGTRMVSGKPPRYPIESRRKHEQGTVVLSLTLGVDGRVASVAITQSSGSPRLDDAARDAVRTWRWEPTIRGGQPVQVRGVVEIPFVLKG